MATIANAASQPLFAKSGTVPDVSGALKDWFQQMVFERVVKTTTGFQVAEAGTPVVFMGVIQPLSARQLALKPEGQRAWTWLQLHADPVLSLNVDEVVTYNGVQTRVMALKDQRLYGYVEYHLVQDWTGSGPAVPPARNVIDGGDASTVVFANIIDGGDAAVTGDNIIDGGNAAG